MIILSYPSYCLNALILLPFRLVSYDHFFLCIFARFRKYCTQRNITKNVIELIRKFSSNIFVWFIFWSCFVWEWIEFRLEIIIQWIVDEHYLYNILKFSMPIDIFLQLRLTIFHIMCLTKKNLSQFIIIFLEQSLF